MEPTIDAHTVERVTAYLWVLLALCGIVARTGRLWVLCHIEPKTPEDRRYLQSVLRSSYFRFLVKAVLLIGGLQAAFGFFPGGFWIWRGGICVALALLLIEDLNVTLSRSGIGREHRGTS